jgi:uncharacterized tellurite resistance protein B-like protein
MPFETFSPEQRRALLDLAVLGMYADRHLAGAEQSRVRRLLAALGFASELEANREFDASVTRVRPFADDPAAVEAQALTLANEFSSREQRAQAFAILKDLLASDHRIEPAESALIQWVRPTLDA